MNRTDSSSACSRAVRGPLNDLVPENAATAPARQSTPEPTCGRQGSHSRIFTHSRATGVAIILTMFLTRFVMQLNSGVSAQQSRDHHDNQREDTAGAPSTGRAKPHSHEGSSYRFEGHTAVEQ